MTYLIDTSCLIDCKNDYYSFEFCPAFWDWLQQQNEVGRIYSVEECGEELKRGKDDLAEWAKRLDTRFFLRPDDAVLYCLTEVATAVENLEFPRHKKAEFLDSGDPLLIAHGLAYKYTIITHESRDKNQLKIPRVCKELKINCATIFDVIKDSGAKFVLR